jgi:hypothetical protein
VSYDCTVLVPEETDEDENLYSEDYLLEDLISDIDIPEGGVNDSRYVKDSFNVISTEEESFAE